MRIRWRDFSKGLYAGGSREGMPQGFARRLSGFSHLGGDYLRLRYRHEGRLRTHEAAQTVHSILRHEDRLYYGTGRGFGFGSPSSAGGAPTIATSLFSHGSDALLGIQGNGSEQIIYRLVGLNGRPVAGKGVQGSQDFLFVAGGGALFKVQRGASGFTRWGIPAPTAPITGNAQDVKDFVYYPEPLTFNSTTRFTGTNLNAGPTVVSDNLEGQGTSSNNCISVTVSTDTTAKLFGTFPAIMDFSKLDDATPLSEQDWFVIDIKVVNIRSLDSIEIKFFNDPKSIGNTGSSNLSALTYTIVVDDAIIQAGATGANGVGDIPEVATDETNFLNNAPDGSSGTNRAVIERLGTTRLSGEGMWNRLKIPRSSFVHSNPTPIGLANRWTQITAWEAIITTNKEEADVTVRFNNGGFVGGVGMQGRYKYCYTVRDPGTGHRSNPSPVTEIDVPYRTGARLNVPIVDPTDSIKNTRGDPTGFQLSTTGGKMIREVWRSFGNGAQFFKCGELGSDFETAGLPVTIAIDTVADWRGLHDLDVPASGRIAGDIYVMRGVLNPLEVVQFDNIAPDHGFMDAFGLAYGRCFWCRDQTPDANSRFPGQGRVYYSPPGRLESVAGFIDVTQGGADPTQKGVIWNGIYVFTQKRCFEIVGVDEPFGAREILGVPGTLWPHTVVPTPYGIIYEAIDGIRAFDGTGSQLLPLPPVEPFFRRDTNAQTNTGLGAFQTNLNHFACFMQDEYRWSDGTNFLAFNLRTGTWREIGGTVPTGLLADAFGECFGGGTGVIQSLEFGSIGGDYTTAVSEQTITYEFETPGAIVDGRDTFLVQRVYLDVLVPYPDTMTVLLVTGDGSAEAGPLTQSLGTYTGTGFRELVEFAVPCAYVSVPGVRLTGASLTGGLRIHGVEADVHIPEEPGAGT